MRSTKKIMALCLATAMIAGMTGCDESAPATSGGNAAVGGTTAPAATPATTTTTGTTADPDENAATDEKAKDIASADFAPDGKAGVVKFLGYYDITTGSDQYLVFQTEEWGGTIEYSSCSSGPAYFEKLGTLIAADDSPDLVTYEWLSFPGGMSKNMYEPLDDYIDYNTTLWADMKESIEDFAFDGKHYYYPYKIKNYFALNYNRKTVEEAGLTDPMQLYKQGNWTWDTWREMMINFCNQDDTHVGYCSTSDVFSSFVATTGSNFVNVSNGEITNNMNEANVTRAMEFVENLYRDGLLYQKELGDWVSPELWAANADQILFLGMEPEWCYSAATDQIQNPAGVENDIFDKVSDFAFVPFPRDPNADKYYQAYDTFGYMVPKGAKNIKGAVDWIYCNRVYETDENVIAKVKEEYTNPEIVTYTSGKFEGQRKWQMMWDEEVYDMMMELRDPEKFSFSFDDAYGFSGDLSSTISNVIAEIIFNGGSWTQLSNEYSPIIDGVLDEYR